MELEAFYDRAAGADIGFIYFAGHGFGLPKHQTESPQVRPPLSAEQLEMRRLLNVRDPLDPNAPETGYTGFITGIDWTGTSDKGALPIAEALLALQRASRIVVVVDACRSPPVPNSAGGNFVELRAGRIPRSLHGHLPLEQRNVFFAASTSNGLTTPDGPPGGHTQFAATFAKLMRESRADQPGFGERLRTDVGARQNGDEIPFFISNLQNSGNPLRVNDELRRNAYASPVLETSLTIANAEDAAITSAGRLVVLHDGSVSDGRGRAVYRSGASGRAIAISPDGSKILEVRGNPLTVGVVGGPRTTPRSRIKDEEVLAAHVTNEGSYAVATDENRLIGRNDLYRGFWPAFPWNRALQTVAASAADALTYFGTSYGLICVSNQQPEPLLGGGWCRSNPGAIRNIEESSATKNLATISARGGVQIRSHRYGYVYADIPITSFANSASWSPIGPEIVVGASNGLVSIWNTEAISLAGELPPSRHAVTRVRFSSDGSKIVVVRENGTIEIWRFRQS